MVDDALFEEALVGEVKPMSAALVCLREDGLLERVRRDTGGEGVWVTGGGVSAAPKMCGKGR